MTIEHELRKQIGDLGNIINGTGGKILQAIDNVSDRKERMKLMRNTAVSLVSWVEGKPTIQALTDQTLYYSDPVNITEFLLDPYYLGLKGQIYPAVLAEMESICSGEYVEVVLTGAIGTAKTTIAVWLQLYQLYLLSLMPHPHAKFHLDTSSEILIVFQSLNKDKAAGVNYQRFKTAVDHSPYFRENFPSNPDLESELHFPNRIIVKPISGDATAAIGENVLSGILDEVNFQAKITKSKRSTDGTGDYDQAIENYNSLAMRRKSRFMHEGKTAGLLCLVSSKRYPGEFTEVKIKESEKEVRETGATTIYVYDKRTWDIKPSGTYTGEWFPLFIGDVNHQSRLLDKGEEVDQNLRHLVDWIPIEYKSVFQQDMIRAIRDVAGISTRATNPFFTASDLVSSCFGTHQSIFSRGECDFVKTKVKLFPNRIEDPERARWVHLDLSVTGDCTGMVMGYVDKFSLIERTKGQYERLPHVKIDFCLQIQPPPNGEILYYKIRGILYKLRDEMGVNIRYVSFDSFQSTDSKQMLKQKGFMTGEQSMDTTTGPYDVLKTAMYDQRVAIPKHDALQEEILSLEFDPKVGARGKVDHPPKGSKDVADSLAGVVYGLTMRRETWLDHGIPLTDIPESVSQVVVDMKNMHNAEAYYDDDPVVT